MWQICNRATCARLLNRIKKPKRHACETNPNQIESVQWAWRRCRMQRATQMPMLLYQLIWILKSPSWARDLNLPSFSVISVDVRQITFQALADDGSVFIFDGFIRAGSSLDLGDMTPLAIKLKDFCFVTVSILYHMTMYSHVTNSYKYVAIPFIFNR